MEQMDIIIEEIGLVLEAFIFKFSFTLLAITLLLLMLSCVVYTNSTFTIL